MKFRLRFWYICIYIQQSQYWVIHDRIDRNVLSSSFPFRWKINRNELLTLSYCRFWEFPEKPFRYVSSTLGRWFDGFQSTTEWHGESDARLDIKLHLSPLLMFAILLSYHSSPNSIVRTLSVGTNFLCVELICFTVLEILIII